MLLLRVLLLVVMLPVLHACRDEVIACPLIHVLLVLATTAPTTRGRQALESGLGKHLVQGAPLQDGLPHALHPQHLLCLHWPVTHTHTVFIMQQLKTVAELYYFESLSIIKHCRDLAEQKLNR